MVDCSKDQDMQLQVSVFTVQVGMMMAINMAYTHGCKEGSVYLASYVKSLLTPSQCLQAHAEAHPSQEGGQSIDRLGNRFRLTTCVGLSTY